VSPTPDCNIPAVPDALGQLPQWVGWLAVEGEGKRARLPNGTFTKEALRKQAKPHKLPINPHTGGLASVTNRRTWGTLSQATGAKHRFGLTGIGFVFTEDDAFGGVDLDDCRDPGTGEIKLWAQQIMRQLNSYTEVSPSQKGVKIFVRGAVPRNGNRAKHETGEVELYSRCRYFTVTGVHVAATPLTLEDRQTELAALHHQLFKGRNDHDSYVPHRRSRQSPIRDDELLDRARQARNGTAFTQLFDGAWKEAGYYSQSEADLALCCHLAFWTNNDPSRIDALFRQSGLVREKWDRQDYRERTIQTAIQQTEKRHPSSNTQHPTTPALTAGALETPDTQLLPAVPVGFRRDKSGVYKLRHDEQAGREQWICGPLEVLAYARSTKAEQWSKLLRFRDPEGTAHEWLFPLEMLATSALGKNDPVALD
jgi:primase-polymerase (primpol)-like protein